MFKIPALMAATHNTNVSFTLIDLLIASCYCLSNAMHSIGQSIKSPANSAQLSFTGAEL